MKFDDLVGVIGGILLNQVENCEIQHLVTDSRKVHTPEDSLFFAVPGNAYDGHEYIPSLFKLGVRNFIVQSDIPKEIVSQSNVIQVKNTLDALQMIASSHRGEYFGKVIAITGSNGKTMVKEWLHEMLDTLSSSVKSPMSYNSQLGVPLSVWQIENRHKYAIMEAGISKVGEMDKLRKILNPSIGIFTNIGEAHQEGFESLGQKAFEKAQLFIECQKVICRKDHLEVNLALQKLNITTIGWGVDDDSELRIVDSAKSKGVTKQRVIWKGTTLTFILPFTSAVFVENAMHCITLLLSEGFTDIDINRGLSYLREVDMRLKVMDGNSGCMIIDDTYNNDLTGLKVAVEQLNLQHNNNQRMVILSDMLGSGLSAKKLYTRISGYIRSEKINKIVGIGKEMLKNKALFPDESIFYATTEEFLTKLNPDDYQHLNILVKGARPFGLERIVHRLQKKGHGTILEINLNQITRNINYYRSRLDKKVRIMAVIKALAYGSGSTEMASHLVKQGVNYFAVAYADEGKTLRKNGIDTPIMVMNPPPEVFHILENYKLEPEIYSLNQLNKLINYLGARPMRIHIKIETGMNRLGLPENDIEELKKLLGSNQNLKVGSIFSHLAASENPNEDDYTKMQASILYNIMIDVRKCLDYSPLLHILNSGGITRFPQFQFDMVRLGIGMHGYSPNIQDRAFLGYSQTLKTFVAQVKEVKKDSSVGYGRKAKVLRDSKLATIGIGYADGYSRKFGMGRGRVFVGGKLVSVVGNVCMDMTIIDVTGLNVNEGDEVIIFGKEPTIDELAESLETITYEVLAGISDRVKRVYVYE